jgi:hypothetical protein
MKKILAFLALGLVLFGSCSAQNAGAQNVNVEQGIIGTWVNNANEREETWVFNADGTLSGIKMYQNDVECIFAASDTKLAISDTGRDSFFVIYSVSISSDGRSLILERTSYNNSGPLQNLYWFTKK